MCISGAVLALLSAFGAPVGYLFELLLPLAACAAALSFLLAVYLYVRSFRAPSHALASGGNTGESSQSSDESNVMEDVLAASWHKLKVLFLVQ